MSKRKPAAPDPLADHKAVLEWVGQNGIFERPTLLFKESLVAQGQTERRWIRMSWAGPGQFKLSEPGR